MAWTDVHTITELDGGFQKVDVLNSKIYFLGSTGTAAGQIVEFDPSGPSHTVIMAVTNQTVLDMVTWDGSLYFLHYLSTSDTITRLARWNGTTDSYTDLDTVTLSASWSGDGTERLFEDGTALVYYASNTNTPTTKNTDFFWRYTTNGSSFADSTHNLFDNDEEATPPQESPFYSRHWSTKGMYDIQTQTNAGPKHLMKFNSASGVWEQLIIGTAKNLNTVEEDVFWTVFPTEYTRDFVYYHTVSQPSTTFYTHVRGIRHSMLMVGDPTNKLYQFNGYKWKEYDDFSAIPLNGGVNVSAFVVIGTNAYLMGEPTAGSIIHVLTDTYVPLVDVTHSQLGIPGNILI